MDSSSSCSGWCQLSSGKSHMCCTQLLRLQNCSTGALPFPVIIPKDFPGYFPVTEEAPPFPVNFWVLTSLPQPLPEVAVDVKQSPEQNRFYCHRNAGASDESSLQGVRIAFAPLPYHLQEKGDTKPSPRVARKPQSYNVQPSTEFLREVTRW